MLCEALFTEPLEQIIVNIIGPAGLVVVTACVPDVAIVPLQ